jgi:hypothetical protein
MGWPRRRSPPAPWPGSPRSGSRSGGADRQRLVLSVQGVPAGPAAGRSPPPAHSPLSAPDRSSRRNPHASPQQSP